MEVRCLIGASIAELGVKYQIKCPAKVQIQACHLLPKVHVVLAAIHAAAGPQLLEACKRLPIMQGRTVRCPTGEAHITPCAP